MLEVLRRYGVTHLHSMWESLVPLSDVMGVVHLVAPLDDLHEILLHTINITNGAEVVHVGPDPVGSSTVGNRAHSRKYISVPP